MIEVAIALTEPVSPLSCDADELKLQFSEEHLQMFLEIENAINTLSDPDKLSDESLQRVIADKVEFYAIFYEKSTDAALAFLGGSDRVQSSLPAGTIQSDSEKQEPNPKEDSSGYTLYRNIISDEFLAAGFTGEEIKKLEPGIRDSYTDFSDEESDIVREKATRFQLLLKSFGDPNVIRAEIQEASYAYFEEFCENIAGLGERPSKDTILRKIGMLSRMRSELSQSEFDSYVARKMDRFEIKSADDLLHDYVRNAVMYYAKAVYGKQPYGEGVLGTIPGQKKWFDSYSARESGDAPTMPRNPRIIVEEKLRKMANDKLFGKNEEWSTLLTNRIKEQEAARGYSSYSYSRRNFGNYSSSNSDWRTKANEDSERTHASGRSRSDIRSADSYQGPDISKLTPEQREIFRQFSMVVSSVDSRNSTTAEVRLVMEELMKDFAKVLEAATSTTTSLHSAILSVMVTLHPDLNLENKEESEQKFKVYNLLRDESKSFSF